MKAAIRRRYGSPSQIKVENVEDPMPKSDEVLIKVYATTVNRTDCANLTAKPPIMRLMLGLVNPRQIIMGTDFAGEVMSVGENVTSYHTGDQVFGFNDLGLKSQAEYLVTKIENIFLMPENIDFKHAAASLEGANYAYSFVHKVNILPGQKILIHGATGAIGSALLQFVRQYDVHITATCRTESIELIETLGADKVYDYTKEDFTKSGDTYDFICDSVGKSTFGKCKPLLKENGIYISSELGPYSQNIFFALVTSISKKKVIFPIPYSKQKTIPYIIDLLVREKFKPLIDREYALEEIARAYEYVLKGQKIGNVIIDLTKSSSL